MIFRRVIALAALVSLAAGKSCVVFDCSWGVYVFGPQANYALGQQSGWGATRKKPSLLLHMSTLIPFLQPSPSLKLP